jgi:O-succinylbenzoate synthase
MLDTQLDIAAIRIHEVGIPLRVPFRIPGGALKVRRSLIVEVEDSSGARGFGESAPFERPFYSEETLYSAKACLIQHLVPRLAGRSFAGLEAAAAALSEGIRGNRFARAGLETALWDLVCARSGSGLRAVLAAAMERLGIAEEFRAGRRFIDSGAALGMPEASDTAPLETMALWAREAMERGYQRVKLKIQPGWDVEPVRVVRETARALGQRVRIWADANGSYVRERDLDRLHALDAEQLVMLEQPLHPDDVLGTIALVGEIATPVCVDESLVDDNAARLFIANHGPRIWNLKVQRVGGLWESLRIYKRAVEHGIKLWGGTMPETGVGTHAILCLGCFAGFTHPSDAAPSERWYQPGSDLIEWQMDREGRIPVSDAAGLASFSLAQVLAGCGRVVG